MNACLILMNGKTELRQNCPVTSNVMSTVSVCVRSDEQQLASTSRCIFLKKQTKLKARLYRSTIDHKASPLDTTAMAPGLSKNLPVSHISQHTDTCTLRRNVGRPVSRHPCTHPYRHTPGCRAPTVSGWSKSDRKELAFLFPTVKKNNN